jgi:hypothetical protein
MYIIAKYLDLIFKIDPSHKLTKNRNRIIFIEKLDVDDCVFKTIYKKKYPNDSLQIFGSAGKTTMHRVIQIYIENEFPDMIRDSKLYVLINGIEKY